MDWKEEFETGLRAHQAGDMATALHHYQNARRIDKNAIPAAKAMAVVLAQTGDLSGGIELMEEVSDLDAKDGENWGNLCFAYLQADRNSEAVSAGEKAVELSPDSAFCHNNYSAALRLEREYGQAFEHARKALELNPGMGEATINAAACLMAVGEIDSANGLLSDLVQREPKNFHAWDNYLFGLHYSAGISSEQICEIHRLYGTLFAELDRLPMRAEPRTVGFVSGDMHRHPVGYFLKNVFSGLSSLGWRVIAFSNREAEDDLSAELKANCGAWHRVARKTDSELAALIRKESVDILIDLAGHTAKNRLPVFALRPAPVQATFLGYSSTTGLKAMDYLIADDATVPDGNEHLYTEAVVRMDRSLYCMPVKIGTDVSEKSEEVVFGSFNNPYKISTKNIEAWAQILMRVEKSRLILKYATLDSEEVRDSFREKLVSAGVDEKRLAFYGHLPYEEHLAIVGSVDVALDSFPYTGATTTVDSIKSSTPTITLGGDRYSSRMSASVLMAFDLSELVANSEEEYVDLAVRLATDREWRKDVRSRLRDPERLARFSDAKSYAESLEKVFFNMWNEVLAIKT